MTRVLKGSWLILATVIAIFSATTVAITQSSKGVIGIKKGVQNGPAVEAVVKARTTSGLATQVFGDPDDFVVQLDQRGRCGSPYFHVQRANKNFNEMVAVVLTAFAADKRLTFFVDSCRSDRNIISHGYVSR